MSDDYDRFLQDKVAHAKTWGFDVDAAELNPALKDHTRAMVRWGLAGGRRAWFASFGLHKTVTQIEAMRLIGTRHSGIRLITTPLGVRGEFFRDAERFFTGDYAVQLKFIRRAEEIEDDRTIYLTNYESVREEILDVPKIAPVATSLDEAAILRGFGGTKTFRQAMAVFAGDDRRDKAQRVRTDGVPFRFVATATPDPNEHIELLSYAAFLGVMDVGQAKTRFFKRNSEKADQLTLHEHKQHEFWRWVASWALFVQRPSDICTCDATISSDNASASSPSKAGTLPRASGSVAASAAAAEPPTDTTSRQAATPAAAARATGTEERAHEHSASGRECSPAAETPTTRTGPTTEAEESPSASAGSSSGTSSPTWDSHPREQRSSATTTTADTSPATAAGRTGASKRKTRGAASTSPSTVEPSLSLHGLASSGSATGSSTAAASWAGRTIGSSATCNCDEGYRLPPLDLRWHELPSDHKQAGAEKDGQERMFKAAAIGVQDAAREKRESLETRVRLLADLVKAGDGSQWVTWCDLNDEQSAIEKALTAAGLTCSSMYGSQDQDEREQLIATWRDQQTDVFLTKPSMYGAGVNLQQAHQMVFVGIGFKFHEVIQALHRIHRFGQKHPCVVHLIYTEAERSVRHELERKWRQHEETVARMTAIIRECGLAQVSMAHILQRSIGVERREVVGRAFHVVHNDCVDETRRMKSDSIGLGLTSIPFSHQYEYSPSYNDFGHTDDNAHFWRQMDFLTPQLYRTLMPGRIFAVHVKDRITPGGINGFGFQTVTRISDQCADHFEHHGFAFLARKTITTDVVRENNQTYRLGWTEQCKDGSRQGAGLPEYLLLFRKPPTDRSNGYADLPVFKEKKGIVRDDTGRGVSWTNAEGYSRARWQYDAHGFMRSSGNRLLQREDLEGVTQERIFKLFRQHSLNTVFDFEHDVALADHVDWTGWLPSKFMLMPPASWHPDVWTDVARMRTLNMTQAHAGREQHLCPLQFDIVDRVIVQCSNRGEEVYDPFGGIFTVPNRAVKLGRFGRACELNAGYFDDGAFLLHAVERGLAVPDMFALLQAEEAAIAEPLLEAVDG